MGGGIIVEIIHIPIDERLGRQESDFIVSSNASDGNYIEPVRSRVNLAL